MANVKHVHITGIAPFNLNEHKPVQPFLLSLVSPTTGLSLEWGREVESKPNSNGGKTAFFRFQLIGTEAVSYSALDLFKQAILDTGGVIDSDRTT